MDPDAPPLVKADTLASQAEQLSSRRAYQQAHGAHTEAAKQYQLAAHATGDTGAAKALLLQRDKQLKLANEVLRKLERGKSKPAISTTSTAAPSAPGQSYVPGAAPQSIGTGATHGSSYAHRAHYSGIGSPNHINHGGNAGQPPHRRNGQAMPSLSLQQTPYGNSARMGAGPFLPRDRIDASTMADSRYSRKSNSPSQSQISHSIPQSGESVKTSSVEESYYLMNTDNDPSDPVANFLTVVENMVEELGNAVAFASAPLHIGPPAARSSGSSALSHARQPSDGATKAESKPTSRHNEVTNQVLESFYVIPSVNRPGKPARESTNPSGNDIDRPNSALHKTHEELVAENSTLKETLDHLSKRLDWMTKERQREKEALKDSVTIFARDVRRQAERLGQSTANLADTRRQMPPISLPLHQHSHRQGNGDIEELQKRLVQAQEETRLARAEAEKQAANAQRYKSRYDDLRKAIIEKRKAKEDAQAAAAAAKDNVKDGSITTSKDPATKSDPSQLKEPEAAAAHVT